MPAPTFFQARDAILKARQRFVDQAMLKMYPSLKGRARARVVLREQRRSNVYAATMQGRLSTRMRAVNTDPMLTPEAKEVKVRKLIESERRFLAQHIAAVGWRIAREAELERLVEAGDTEGYWLIDHSKRTHTADCLAAAGKVHSIDWLRMYGPPTRHNGCGCRTISVREARMRGFPLRRGSPSPAAMVEAVKVPVRPGMRAGDPYSKTAEVTIGGTLHRALAPYYAEYRAAVKAGDGLAMQRAYERMRNKTSLIKSKPQKEAQQRLVDRIHAAAINPEGFAVDYGTHVDIGGTEVAVPLSPHEKAGMSKGWTSDGRFAWLVTPGALGRGADAKLAELRDSRRFKMIQTPEGILLTTNGRQSITEAHSAATHLELQLPQLRRARVVKRGVALGDDTPLDLRPDMGADWNDPDARHRGITRGQIGDAGELAMGDVAKALAALGYSVDATHKPFGLKDGRRHGKLDARLGDFGAEIKATVMRSLVGGRRTGTISPAGRSGKVGMANALKLRPILVHPIIDFDNNVVHVFAHIYDRGQGFYERRMPAGMVRELVAGRLVPGQEAEASEGGNQMIYVGTFRLRYNPNDRRDQGKELRDAQGRMYDSELTARLEEKPLPAQISPSERRRRATRSERDALIISLAGGGRHTQKEIAAAARASQTTVSRVLTANGIHLGQGNRTDRKRRR